MEQFEPAAEDLEDLYENAPCGYLSLSPTGVIVKVNLTFCEWTGTRREQIIGRRFRDLLTMGSRMFYETHFAPLLRLQGFFNEVAIDLVAAEGGRLPVLANARERRSDAGELQFTRITIFLAAERRRYERELVSARRTADASSRELAAGWEAEKELGELREQFIAVLGHDLRNPLAAIVAGVRALRRRQSDTWTQSVLAQMESSTQRMSALIDNVLDFARGRLGDGLSLTLATSKPLAETLQLVVDEIRSAHSETVIEANLTVTENVRVDHARIAQLLSNLLGNAVTHGDSALPVRVEASTVGGRLTISVANAGHPIEPKTMAKLFQPFNRGEVKPEQQGLGLGLFIASEIAKAHGGRIDVVSDEQETVFTFVMPLF